MSIFTKILSIILTFILAFSLISASGTARAAEPLASPSSEASAETAVEMNEPAPLLDNEDESVPAAEGSDTGFGLPNVYFFIMDEYSSFDMLNKYYQYDNKQFDDFLNDRNFNVIKTSYSTDNQTEHTICDTLNLKYISRHFSKSKCYKAISTAALYKAFSGLGYTQFQYSKAFRSIPSLLTKNGRKLFKSIIIDKSASASGVNKSFKVSPPKDAPVLSEFILGSPSDISPFGFYKSDYIRNTKAYKRSSQRRYINSILNIFDYFENPANYPVTKPRVTYCYFKAAHVPFIFNQYGNIIPSRDRRNWRDKKVYLDQYKFISRHMMATVSTIINNDPESIIIIMSDHGIRYHGRDCSKYMKFVITDKDSLRIMNAVYIKGQKYTDMEGLSAINTLRYILRLYGLNYPPIVDPVTINSPACLKGIIPRSRHN